jgi:dihydroorotase-like cyclic amidohydrolase
MGTEELEEMGPVDYVVIEWPPGKQPTGEAAPIVVDLVERGIIRVLDFGALTKAEDGSVAGLEVSELAGGDAELKVFEGASSGLLGDDDLAEAAEALEPGATAAVLVYENTWAAPLAVAARRSGAQLVAGGRIPVQALLAALEAAEEGEAASTAS